MRLWCVLRRDQKIAKQLVSDIDSASPGDISEALRLSCKYFDIPAPIMLGKHESEIEIYGRTAFSADDFIETLPYDKLEIEIIPDEGSRSRRSKDPRNNFS